MGDGCPNTDCEWHNPFRTFAGTPEGFVGLLADLWDFDYGDMTVEEYRDEGLALHWRIRLVTGGWSRNEEIIEDLAETFFHALFWESIHRDGLHIYHVSRGQWEQEWAELGRVVK